MKKIIFALFATIFVAAFTCCNKTETKQDAAIDNVFAATGEVTNLTATDVINENPEVPTVVDFNATWCGPCRTFAPIFEAAAKTYEGKIAFLSVDVDVCSDLADKYGIQSIPTVLFIKPDGSIERNIGFMDADTFSQLLDKML